MIIGSEIFDSRSCVLGEGPLWHPERQQLFWFDIINCQLLSKLGEQVINWDFDRHVSAAAWVDHDHLLIAGETGLSLFNLQTSEEEMLCEIEANIPLTRSNDGRADPWGGFWMGTMGKSGEKGLGALYRWVPEVSCGVEGGELRVLLEGMSTPNAICFDKSRSCAYYADTKTRTIWRQPVNSISGWPEGDRSVFVDLTACDGESEHKPDGAIVDAQGCVWNAQWGSARVACYSPEGKFLRAIEFPTGHTSCPAIGGTDLKTLFVTTATQKLPEDRSDWHENAGKTFFHKLPINGLPEPRIKLQKLT